MNIHDYISDKLKAFGVTEAQLADIMLILPAGVGMSDEITAENARDVNLALIGAIEEFVLAPKSSSVSESGFSFTWDFGKMAQYYTWLCRKYGVSPNRDILELSGINVISDKTDIW